MRGSSSSRAGRQSVRVSLCGSDALEPGSLARTVTGASTVSCRRDSRAYRSCSTSSSALTPWGSRGSLVMACAPRLTVFGCSRWLRSRRVRWTIAWRMRPFVSMQRIRWGRVPSGGLRRPLTGKPIGSQMPGCGFHCSSGRSGMPVTTISASSSQALNEPVRSCSEWASCSCWCRSGASSLTGRSFHFCLAGPPEMPCGRRRGRPPAPCFQSSPSGGARGSRGWGCRSSSHCLPRYAFACRRRGRKRRGYDRPGTGEERGWGSEGVAVGDNA